MEIEISKMPALTFLEIYGEAAFNELPNEAFHEIQKVVYVAEEFIPIVES